MDDSRHHITVESEIGIIPASWELVPFGDLFDSKLGKMLSKAAKQGRSPQPYLRNANVQWLRVDVSDLYEMDFDADECKRFRLKPGDILICEGGEVGRTAIWNGELDECYYQKAIHRARPKNGRMSGEFLMFFMLHAFTGSQRRYFGFGTETTIAHLPAVKLKALPIPVPPHTEQKAIAHILRTVQQAKEATEKVIASSQQLKQSMMRHLFTYGPVPFHDADKVELQETEVGEIPATWKVKTIGDLISDGSGRIQTGPFGSQLHKEDYKESGIPVVNPTHLGFNAINDDGIPRISREDADRLAKHYLLEGDILIARRGDFSRYACIRNADEDRLCGTGCMRIRVKNESLSNPFLGLAFATESIQSLIRDRATGTIMPNINGKILSQLPIPIPPLDEQVVIEESITAIDGALDVAERRHLALSNLLQSILHYLMTGKVRVHEAEKTVAEMV